MRVSCPTCKTAYNIDETKIPPGGAKLKCSKCQNTFPIGTGPAAVPLPGNVQAPPSAAVPLPGKVGASRNTMNATAVPLPGGTRSPASAPVPLPGARPTMAASAVPLPAGRSSAMGAVPLPAGRSSMGPAAVPLPASGGVPDDLEADFNTDVPGAVPLPGAVATGPAEELGDFDSPPNEAPQDDFAFNDAVPPPRPVRGNTPGEFDLPTEEGSSGDAFAMDFGAQPPADAPEHAPAPMDDPFAADLDSFAAPSAPAPAAPAGDDLEFDPTSSVSSARSTAPAADDLEADLSAPVPASAPAAPAGDDLELLDFIDDAAAATKAKPRRGSASGSTRSVDGGFQVRKKSGQVLGPLPESEVTKLLSDGRLLGNEDISQDGGATWSALGSHPTFAEALQRLMEAPSVLPGATAASDASAEAARSGIDVNERFKQIYGGRMAGINIVDSQESYTKIKKNLPQIIAGALVALFLTVGLAQGLTPKGIFWRKVWHPTKINPGDALFQKLVNGRADFDEGSFGGLQRAQASADAVLKENDDYLQARSLYVLSTYELQKRYQHAAPADLDRSSNYVKGMLSINKSEADTIAARAAEELAIGSAEDMRAGLQDAVTKHPELGVELTLLLAQSYVASKTADQAKAAFTQADTLGTMHRKALTLHATYLSTVLHDNAAAGALLQKAVTEKAEFGPAAIDLATLDVGPLAQPEKALEVLKPIAAGTDLSQEERARVHALTGMVLLFQKKATEAEAEFKQGTDLAPNSPAVEGAYAGYMLKRRDYESAVPLFQNAYTQRPDDLDVLEGLVTALVGKGNLVDANKVVIEADGRLPNNARVAYLKGMVSDGADKGDEAIKNYTAAIAGDPKFTKASLALARFDLRHARIDEAKKLLADALAKEPENPELNAATGDVALAERRMDDAVAAYDKAIKLDADLAAAHLGRASVLFAKGNLPDAHAEADTALKQDERLPGTNRLLGIIEQSEKDYPKAKLALQTANKQDPKDEDALLHLGEVSYQMGDFDGAQTALENARTINRSDPEVHFYLALTHNKKTEKTQAIEEMNKAMEYGGMKNAEYHYNFGLIYKGTEGRFSDAVDEFKAAIKLKPDYLDALEAYADALAENNDFAGAVESYEKIFTFDSKRTSMLGKVGDAYQKKNDFNKAIDAFHRHLLADPTAVGDHFKIGKAYDDLNKRKEAAAAYREAVTADATNADAWKALGYDLKELGKASEAVKSFETYLKLKPAAEDLAEVQDTIEGTKADAHLK